ncbi:biotin--[acetyl-CoA-carboxylase] ligase [Cellulophaga sp. Hel_I_12]|uniref:biotin--[acetyl-CoA-carboxylase] ligase n=1 Tax=Cellulophaga sp. Hel_I_12 TaxID=1249972 RepID=UPI00064567E2|nr:biotin--[acetyl-CoA-carboxylase] ligase [Cellulophaga sp. Hel_I_12]
MHLIKLDATASTNVYLKKLSKSRTLADFTVVVAKEQLEGKGQMGSSWQSEKGKNLTSSILKHHEALFTQDHFYLNITVSLAIYHALKDLEIPDLSIKWPNDILSGNSKICGILIENMLSGQKITTSIIGIGLNVNQTQFNSLPKVSSLHLLKGKAFDLDEILIAIAKNLEQLFTRLKNGQKESLKEAYLNVLFKKDKPSTFGKVATNQLFVGIIRSVSEDGKLEVEVEDQLIEDYDLKEIRLMY